MAALLFLPAGSVAALSALSGGLVATGGGVIYALVLRKVSLDKPSAVLYLHVAAELAKLLGMFAGAAALFVFFRQLSWAWFFAGFFVVYSVYWFGLLMKN